MRQIKVYITSKREHAAKLRGLKMDGIHINARWIWLDARGDVPVTHWLREDFDDAIASDYVVFYMEAGDDLNTSLIEIGNAFAWGKPVLLAGDRHLNYEEKDKAANEDFIGLPHKAAKKWCGFDKVKVTGSLEQTLLFIKREVNPTELVTKAGKVAV